MALTWNPSDKGAAVNLSNGNLTVSRSDNISSDAQNVRTTSGVTSGKWYYESTCTANMGAIIPFGVCNETTLMSGASSAFVQATGWGWHAKFAIKGNNNVFTAYGSAATEGDIIGVAFDVGAHKIWFSKNGTWQDSGDPAAGTNPAYSTLSGTTFYPTLSISDDGTDPVLTANFGTTALTYSVPSGFTKLSDSVVNPATMALTETQDTTTQAGTVVVPTGTMALTETADTFVSSLYNSTPYTVTWNPSDKGANITLSGGNLTAAFGSAIFNNETVRATLGRSTGKYYFEVNHGGNPDYRMSGVCSANVSVSTGFVASSEGFAYFGSDGKFYTNNAGSTYGSTYNTSVIGIAVDLDAHKLWFAKDGTWQNSGDPAAGTNPATSSLTSGLMFPASMGNNLVQAPSVTGSFGDPASALVYTPPTGYSKWNTDFYVSVNIASTDTQDTCAGTGSQSAAGSLSVIDTADTFTGTGHATDLTETLFVAVGHAGKITTSANGTTWSPQFSGVTEQLRGVAQAGSGGAWVVVGYGGRILYSLDGEAWAPATSGTVSNLENVSYGNGTWVIVGWNGTILTSTNGTTWTPRVSGTTVQLNGISYAVGTAGAVWVAMGASGIYRTSTNDGVTWANSNSPLSVVTTVQDVAWSSNLAEWVAVGIGTANKIYTSVDGGSWTVQATPSGTRQPYCVVWGNPYWVVGEAGPSVATSTNGTSWTAQTAISTGGHIYGVAFDGTTYVAVGNKVSSSVCYTTTDPTSTWTQRTTGEGASSLNAVYAGDILTPTPPDVYGILQSTETTDTLAGTGNSDTTGVDIVVGFSVTEDQDTFSGVTASTTIAGDLIVTDTQDTALFTQGGGAAVAIQLLPATFDLIVTYGAFLFNGGTLNVYTGNQPIDPTTAPSGNLLASIILPDPAFEEADDGECIKTGDWSGAATDTGVAGWFRLTSEDGLNSIDGSVSTSLGTGDVIASTINFTIGDPVEVTSATFAFTLLNA